MRYLSVCSGIEAASVAWQPIGFEAVGFAEIDPFACAVLQHRFPNVTNYGDMTNYENWKIGQFDVLVGGTPCQSFSVAGRRKSLSDDRGKLSLCFCRIAERFAPEWIVWENVPAVLSTRDNAFHRFINALCGRKSAVLYGERGGFFSGTRYNAAWCVLNAADFGVPQERKRLFLVAVRSDRHGSIARFFSEAPRGGRHSAKSGEGGEAHTRSPFVSSSLRFRWYDWHGRDARITRRDKTASTVTRHYGTGGGNRPIIVNLETDTARWVTPLECERLQGLPDNWTAIPWRGKPAEKCPKSLRYQAIGNSMVVPVMRWIGEKIQQFKTTENE